MLTSDSSRYAVIAARCGIADALVALANTVRKPGAEKRGRGALLRNEIEALKSLVPSGGAERAAIADYILKHKGKLVFDQTSKIYTLP